MKRVAIYARVSTQDQGERQTIQSQLMACREFCETRDYRVSLSLLTRPFPARHRLMSDLPVVSYYR